MKTKIQIRRDTAANWTSNNPTLSAGEFGYETDTGKLKIGTGSSAWTSLAYASVLPSDLDELAQDSINSALVAGVGLDKTYNDSANTITLDIDSTVTTNSGVQTLSNKSISGTANTLSNIPNNALSNSSVTINGYTISLGGTAEYSTDNINEGTSNKYFTDERAQDAAAQALSNGTHTNISVSYDDANNAISLTGAVTYTDENARDAVAGLITSSTHSGISVDYTDDGANAGSLSFTNTDKGSSQNIFKNISVDATVISADSNNDTLIVAAGTGISLSGDSITDTFTITNAGVTSLSGTSNEIEVSGSTGAITIGLPNDVTITGNLTLSGNPTLANHAANKAYVDNVTAGLNFHAAVHAATNAALDAAYNNGTSGVGATLTSNSNEALVVDGHTLSVGERVLVKNQDLSPISAGLQNGIYVVTATGDGSNPWVLTRATDADNSPSGELAYGDFCFVQAGGQAGYGYILNTPGTITIGSTSISYVQFSAGQVVIAGNGLTETSPGTFAIDTTVTADLSSSQTLTNKTISSANNTITVTPSDVTNFAEAAQDAAAQALANGTHTNITVSYNDGLNAISLTGVEPLPSQSGNADKFLTTNGTAASWQYPKIPTGTTESLSPSEGQLYFNINDNALRIYSGGAWLTLSQVSMDSGTPYTSSYEISYDGGSPDIEPTAPIFDGGFVA